MDGNEAVLHRYDFVCPFCYVGQQRNKRGSPIVSCRRAPGADSRRALGAGYVAATAPATLLAASSMRWATSVGCEM